MDCRADGYDHYFKKALASQRFATLRQRLLSEDLLREDSETAPNSL